MAEEVKLLGTWASPFSRRVELALRLKGVPFEYIDEDLSNKSPELLQYNPVHKQIPVLVHNGKPIAESLVILDYVDETWQHSPILPADPLEKAKARFWARFIDEKLRPATRKVVASKGEKQKELAIQEVQEQLRSLESELKEKLFFGGERLRFVDLAGNMILCLPVSQEAQGIEILSEEKFPILHGWRQRLLQDAVFKECVPPREPLLAFLKARFGASTCSK